VVIEDDTEVAHLLEVIPIQAGFQLEVAHDGLTGVEAVRRLDPDLTTVELALPGIDGLEATRRIRRFSSTYIVVVTGRSGEDAILGGFEAGADDYTTKPFRPRELRARCGPRGRSAGAGAGVDDRSVVLSSLQLDLLETLLYRAERTTAVDDLAASLRGEIPGAVAPRQDTDRAIVTEAMGVLLARLGERTEAPRWVERVPLGYRLVRPV
jgi:DNA-binding response OmpR family regulator